MSKPLPPVRRIIFDIGNVIVRSTHQLTYAILDDLGVKPDKRPFFFHNPSYGAFARGQITGDHFAAVVGVLLEKNLTYDEIRHAHDYHLYDINCDVAQILYDLAGGSLMPLAFATTTNEWQTEREKALVKTVLEIDLERYGPVARSNLMGVTKTDPDAWPVILDALGIPRNECTSTLFVDDASVNCQAAAAAGLQAIQFKDAEQLRKALNGILSRR